MARTKLPLRTSLSYHRPHEEPAADPQAQGGRRRDHPHSRGKGGHVVARYRGRQTTVPSHGDRDIGPDFIREICKQLSLDPRRVL